MKKTILITGSTDGIGKLAAIQLAKEGHQVYVHGRNSKKLDAVIAEIKAESDNEEVKGFVADFSDLKAVKNMAAEVNQELSKLDVLINNAGIFKTPVTRTKDNFDIRFSVNYFAPYILTKAVLPLLHKGDKARVINLSSAAQAPVSLDALSGKGALSANEAYAQSKLALAMWTFHLAEAEPDLVAIPVNPGSLLNTNMVKEAYGFHRSSANKGRDILYDLAISEKYSNESGKYFDNDIGTFGRLHPAGSGKEAINKLVAKTETLLS